MSFHPLPQAPLVLVTAQVRFSPVENIEQFIPSVHEKLRPLGYPYCDKKPLQNVNISGSSLNISVTDQWSIQNKQRVSSIVLTKNSLTINTCEYSYFAEFLPRVRQIVDIVSESLGIDANTALEQVGLRYIDFLRSIGDKEPEELIDKKYWGEILEKVRMRQLVLEKNTNTGIIRIVLFRPLETQSVILDIQTSGLDLKLPSCDGPVVVLDMDHFKDMQGADFDREVIYSTINDLHEELDHLFFNEITTEEARILWNGGQPLCP